MRVDFLGYRHGDNPARWRGHLEKILATSNKVAEVERHSALDYADISACRVDTDTAPFCQSVKIVPELSSMPRAIADLGQYCRSGPSRNRQPWVLPIMHRGRNLSTLQLSARLWQFATDPISSALDMSKSLRVSDTLFVAAQNSGSSFTRSTAQQVEHWARLGQTIEAAGLSVAQAIALLNGDLETVVSEDAMWQDKRRPLVPPRVIPYFSTST